ncbi:response regulator transcription factor [Paenibacillus sp.]|uniref:response regulator transcription factor n=1 Tax=Paenibacillus sp. TaxID=58172 RepID=UPI002D3C7B1B|nr:response regulator transcription factor [Paenibacillus sp.]HZG87650.1 response regulator transcription factor [Paenibacillus sp.]
MELKTVVIAERQTLLREGVRKIIESEPDLSVVAACESSAELIAAVRTLRPSAAIVDVGLKPRGGIDLTFWAKEHRPDTKIILFADDLDDDDVVRSIAAGADGFLLKDTDWSDLLGYVRAVLQGHLYVPERLAKKLSTKLFRMLSGERNGNEHMQSLSERFRLTEKEYEISLLMARGLSNRQIAEALMYSDGTVRNYVSNVYEKIGIRDRAKAVIFLREAGFQQLHG